MGEKTTISITPRSRSQEEILFSDGSREVRCYSPANPHYYKDGDGVLRPIDMDAVSEKGTGVGQSKIRSDNVVSAGIRSDGQLAKAVGLRPDFSQATGDHQLEFTLMKVLVDGVDQDIAAHVSAPSGSSKNARAWDMGRYLVIQNRRYCRQAVLIARPEKSFRIEFLLQVKGLVIESVPGRVAWKVSDVSGEVNWMIAEPLVLDENLDIIHAGSSLVVHSLTNNMDGTFTYVKESVPGADFSRLPSVFWVDVSTVYSAVEDGYLANRAYQWLSCRNSETAITSWYDSATLAAYANNLSGRFNVARLFLYFSMDGLAGVVEGCSLSVHYSSWAYSRRSLCIQRGLQGDTLSLSDFDAFTGDYFCEMVHWSTGWRTYSLGASAQDYLSGLITEGGVAKFCVRELEHDFNNSAPGTNSYFGGGFYSADSSGNTYDPYLSITLGQTQTRSVAVDGVLLSHKELSLGVDATLGDFSGCANSGLSVAVEQQGELSSASVDGIVGVRYASTALKADIVVLPTRSVPFDAVVLSMPSSNVICSGCLLADESEGVAVDGVLREYFSCSTDMDALSEALKTSQATLSGCLLSDALFSITGCHGFLKTQAFTSMLLDACPAIGTGTETVLVDGQVLGEAACSVAVDAIAVYPVEEYSALDGVVATSAAGSVSDLDAAVWSGGGGTAACDGLLSSAETVSCSSDAVLLGQVSAAASIDAIAVVGEGSVCFSDSLLSSGWIEVAGMSACLSDGGFALAALDAWMSETSVCASGADCLVSGLYESDADMDACLSCEASSGVSVHGLTVSGRASVSGIDASPVAVVAVFSITDSCLSIPGLTGTGYMDAMISIQGSSPSACDVVTEQRDRDESVSASAVLEATAFVDSVMDAVRISIASRMASVEAAIASVSLAASVADAVLAGRRIPPGATANEIIYSHSRVRQIGAAQRVRSAMAAHRIKTIHYTT